MGPFEEEDWCSSMNKETEELERGVLEGRQKKMSEWVKTNGEQLSIQDLRGTFADNMKAPIHRWFRYSAGFSYSLVEESFRKFGITKDSVVLDPFVGVGTTCVCAKRLGIQSVGVEAHPLVAWIARVKTEWGFDFGKLKTEVQKILSDISETVERVKDIDLSNAPKLLQNSYSPQKLSQLYAIKDYILGIEDSNVQHLCILALLSTLRKVSKAHTGWPYILPKKERKRVPDVFKSYQSQLNMMFFDLETVVNDNNRKTVVSILTKDARDLTTCVEKGIDFAFTSPPYLNNFDFADRTRLELYFLSPYKLNDEVIRVSSWNDVTQKIRTKLLVNVSHQAVELGLREGLMPDPEITQPVREDLITISNNLRLEKQKHGGHKDYDISVVAYFNDMFKTLKEIWQVMKPQAYYLLILGDSAPYGMHVKTDVLLSQIALGVGFSKADIHILRTRGDKWISAPKHRVPLRESLVVLRK